MNPVEKYLPQKTIDLLKKQQYALFGHSAVKICHYTKTSITENKTCYKQKFYGIQSHQCIQMSPASSFCDQKCTYCWRPTQTFIPQMQDVQGNTDVEVDNPKEIVEESMKMQKKQLSGIGGRDTFNKVKFEQSKSPKHVAISLTGEPTLYDRLPEMIQEYHAKGISTFLVSNALHPEMLERLIESPPTQLYVSIDTARPEVHYSLNKPQLKDSWERLNKSLELLPKIPTRTVVRITGVKGKNFEEAEEYAQLIKKGDPDFIEIKAYMHVGFSQYRLKAENMPKMTEVQAFAEKVAQTMGYDVRTQDEGSLVVLLAHPRWKGKSTIINFRKLFPFAYEKTGTEQVQAAIGKK
jgi:tRNA wybutosine-synthesizing protein 1